MRLHSLGDNRQINTLTMCSDLCLWYEMVSNTLYSRAFLKDRSATGTTAQIVKGLLNDL